MRSNDIKDIEVRDISRLYPAKSAKLTSYTTPSKEICRLYNTVWRKCLTAQNFDEWSSQGF